MIKLTEQYSVELGMQDLLSRSSTMTRFMPFRNGRAVVFGWGGNEGVYGEGSQLYWLAEITRDGVSRKVLPFEITAHFNDIISRPTTGGGSQYAGQYIRAFKLGEKFGLLLASNIVYLFSDIDAQPQEIEIANNFSAHSAKKHESFKEHDHFTPEYCGNASGRFVPVIFSSPQDNKGNGRHVSLLEIDEAQGTAQWLHTRPDGSPRTTQLADYEPYCGAGLGSALSFGSPPVLYDCAWVDNHWLIYAAGFSHVYQRYGMSPSVLTRNSADLALLGTVYDPGDAVFGRIASSLDRLLIHPLSKNGVRKGKASVYTFGDKTEHEVKLPKGCANFVIEEHDDGCYWLIPARIGWGNPPYRIVACREAG